MRLKLEKDSLDIGLARSGTGAATGSGRGAVPGAGEVGRLVGRRKAGALRVYISFA